MPKRGLILPEPPGRPSSAVRGLSWDVTTETLFVSFANGETYAYLGVPASAYQAFCDAPSKGRHFQAKVRDRYRYRRMPSPQ